MRACITLNGFLKTIEGDGYMAMNDILVKAPRERDWRVFESPFRGPRRVL
jgi:hypothetical protein